MRALREANVSTLDMQKMETFLVVASTSNFTRAAAELGYSQSTVTTHIKSLEKELDTVLLERWRFSKQVVLTDAGRRMLDYARRILALAAEARQAVGAKSPDLLDR